jgi:hypothetical protein
MRSVYGQVRTELAEQAAELHVEPVASEGSAGLASRARTQLPRAAARQYGGPSVQDDEDLEDADRRHRHRFMVEGAVEEA